MKKLRLFNSAEQYNNTKNSLRFPTVSKVDKTNIVKYINTDNTSEEITENYADSYLTFEALGEGQFELFIKEGLTSEQMTSVSYSIDNGTTWTTTTIDGTEKSIITPVINKGDKVLWKGIGKQTAISSSICSTFSSSCYFNAYGNVMSLLYGDNFEGVTEFSENSTYNFAYLFNQTAGLRSIKNLILPVEILTPNCYQAMFNACTALISVTALPAKTLANNCYSEMFCNCTKLKHSAYLPSMNLANSCYSYMFAGCYALTFIPQLPALVMADSCYRGMFASCTGLVKAPKIMGQKLAFGCYWSMFQGCYKLTEPPELPVTTLANNCYISMFQACRELTKAPLLPAVTLAANCYNNLFNGCSALNYIKALFTTTPSNSYSYNWVNNVAASGTFVKNSAATWTTTGVHGAPSGWTIETASA